MGLSVDECSIITIDIRTTLLLVSKVGLWIIFLIIRNSLGEVVKPKLLFEYSTMTSWTESYNADRFAT